MTTAAASDAGTITLAGHTVPRMGFGAMRLPGPGVWGPPPDRDRAIAVCRRAVELGVRVIDTAWCYGDDVSNEILAAALRPYPGDLVFVTNSAGAAPRTPAGRRRCTPSSCGRAASVTCGCSGWTRCPCATCGGSTAAAASRSPTRWAPCSSARRGEDRCHRAQRGHPRAGPHRAGGDRHRERVQPVQPAEARRRSARHHCAAARIPYLPFFPLAIGSVADPGAVSDIAAELGVTAAQVALAWLLTRSPWMLPIPGTGDPAHLAANVAAGALTLPDEARARLNTA